MPSNSTTKGRSATATKASTEYPKDIRDYISKYGDKLSAGTRRGKWIASQNDSPDRNGQTLVTRSHDVIQKWAGERGAKPATVGEVKDRPRVLRFDFPGYGGEGLRGIDWKDWFRSFDERNLAFVYQEKLKNGNQSNFFKLDSPER